MLITLWFQIFTFDIIFYFCNSTGPGRIMQINIMVSKAVNLFDIGKAKTNDSVVSIWNLFKTLYEININILSFWTLLTFLDRPSVNTVIVIIWQCLLFA